MAEQTEVEKLKNQIKELSAMLHDNIVGEQAAWIEWQHGRGAEAAMHWIHNGLCGPGLIPDEGEPYATEAQAYYDANKSDPFPVCHCGRPSNRLWMGHGACCDEHLDAVRERVKGESEAPGGMGPSGA